MKKREGGGGSTVEPPHKVNFNTTNLSWKNVGNRSSKLTSILIFPPFLRPFSQGRNSGRPRGGGGGGGGGRRRGGGVREGGVG